MDAIAYTKIQTAGVRAPLKVRKGHFATNHCHTNYYLDLTTLKSRVSEAHEIAQTLSTMYLYGTIVDTILCAEGTEVIGAYLAEELSKAGFLNTNAHKTIYVIQPEYNSNSQIIFRDNLKPMIQGKNVLILEGSISTGKSVNKIMEAVNYYGGTISGISALFSAIDHINGIPVLAVFGRKDLPDYSYADYHDCPLCKKGIKLDALVNAFGISAI
jgi:orotate phosphoribosyltransferase